MNDKKTSRSIAKNLPMLTQFGLNLIVPLLLCIWGGAYLQKRFALGTWVMAVALILGLLGAASGVISFANYALRQADEGGRAHKEED